MSTVYAKWKWADATGPKFKTDGQENTYDKLKAVVTDMDSDQAVGDMKKPGVTDGFQSLHIVTPTKAQGGGTAYAGVGNKLWSSYLDSDKARLYFTWSEDSAVVGTVTTKTRTLTVLKVGLKHEWHKGAAHEEYEDYQRHFSALNPDHQGSDNMLSYGSNQLYHSNQKALEYPGFNDYKPSYLGSMDQALVFSSMIVVVMVLMVCCCIGGSIFGFVTAKFTENNENKQKTSYDNIDNNV